MQSGKPVVDKDLPEADYKAALQAIGVPAAFAEIHAASDAKAADILRSLRADVGDSQKSDSA
jgi:hypothetical protein